MKIAICAPFMKSDLWQGRLRRVFPSHRLEFDEFYRPEDVRGVSRFRYSACVVAIAGAAGLETAVAVRERDADVPIVWLSDDDRFALMAYSLRKAMFLGLDCSDRELGDAMQKVHDKELKNMFM